MIIRLKRLYNEFPQQFWLIIGASFIDFLGTTMVFPFFALYITQKFRVGMTTAGVLLGVYSLGSLIGRWFGGTWTDRFGRRKLIMLGPVFGAISSILLAITGSLLLMYPLSVLIGFIGGGIQARRKRHPCRPASRFQARGRLWYFTGRQ